MSVRTFALPIVVSLLVAGIVSVNTVQAAPIPLSPAPSLDDLVDDPSDPADDPDASLTSPSGDFRFENFTFAAAPGDDYVPAAEDVFVTMTETENAISLLFQIVGRNLASGPEAFDLEVQYDVVATGPLGRISGQSLFMNGRGFGDGNVVINEEILDAANSQIAVLTTNSNVNGLTDQVMESATFAPQTSVTLNKGIAVNGGSQNGNGVGFLSHFEQTLDVERVPEPSSLALLTIVGLVGVAAVRKTRRS